MLSFLIAGRWEQRLAKWLLVKQRPSYFPLYPAGHLHQHESQSPWRSLIDLRLFQFWSLECKIFLVTAEPLSSVVLLRSYLGPLVNFKARKKLWVWSLVPPFYLLCTGIRSSRLASSVFIDGVTLVMHLTISSFSLLFHEIAMILLPSQRQQGLNTTKYEQQFPGRKKRPFTVLEHFL